MAKKALLDVLEQTIGKYVKNLDAESLNVAVWSGKIQLHSLELDIDAVNAELDRQAAEAPNLAVPLKVVSGSFDSLQVDVPWSKITSRPVVMSAKGLRVFVEPFDRISQADHLQSYVAKEENRAAKIHAARKQSIEQYEKYRLQANAMRKLAQADLEKSSNASSSSFSSRLVRRIIENIQIEIDDVHVSLKDYDGSAGVVLESLSLVTTDKDGNKTFVDRTLETEKTFLYKDLLIRGFGMYIDQNETSYDKLVPINESEASAPIESTHSYVLAPLSFKARLRQSDSKVCIDYAKYLLSSELSSLSILLSRNQLDYARKISAKVTPSGVACPLFPEYRPLSRVTKETAADWWKYALRCVGRLNGKRSWAEFYLAFKKRKKYIPLYKRSAHSATCPWIKPLDIAEFAVLESIEQDRTISTEGIMSWRNIADAQVEKEREKHAATRPKEKGSMFSSIFGSNEKTVSKQNSDEEPPIHLSLDELKELEDMSKMNFADEEVSNESKLYDVKFVMASLKINLTSYDLRHIASLDMGTVMAGFNAGADGAFDFSFKLSSAEVRDMTTPNSLFPYFMRRVNSSNAVEGALVEKDDVFKLHLEKTKSGNQKLLVKLDEFEMVASPVLMKEVKKFFSGGAVNMGSKQNPLLAQSMSGSVDLFYDADEGTMPTQPTGIVTEEQNALSTTNDISKVLIEAWNTKTKTKASWAMDIDINAPVIVIPEKCSDPRADVLVFDLGHAKLSYGKIGPSEKVTEWYRDNPRLNTEEVMVDVGNLEVTDLTFIVGKAGSWRSLIDQKVSNDSMDNGAIVEPISASLDFGIESGPSELVPRVCAFGVVPSISLRLSPAQGSSTLAVATAWMDFLDDIKDSPSPDDITGTEEKDSLGSNLPAKPIADSLSSRFQMGEGSQAIFYLVVGLQQLSVTIVTGSGDGMEAHLVSVYASTSVMADGSSLSQLKMGWFWVLDRLQCASTRRQRLVAHSNLPVAPEEFARGEKYAVMETLSEQGVFERDFSGSNELADVTMKKMPPTESEKVESLLNISFSSLFIHWNPVAVKGLTAMMEKFTSVFDEHAAIAEQSSLIVSPEKTPRSTTSRFAPSPGEITIGNNVTKGAEKSGRMSIRAKMKSLDINLNSALDDHPLFVLTMSRAQVNIDSSHAADKGLIASLVLGDLRMTTPDMGKTKRSYRTLLGLAPGRSESLLTVKYCIGTNAIKTMDLPSVETSALEACAEVDLSPMRIVYVHSQIMALVEYISEGILGALAAQAATSAAEAAKEIANSVAGEKFFFVKATAFDLVLPQAAYREKSMSIHAGSLTVGYRMFPLPGGGEAKVALSDVALKGAEGEPMQETPIRMDIDVLLPPDEVGTLDDQAMRVDIQISQATFIVSRFQYAQILRTLDENMGEIELFLRDDGPSADTEQVSLVGEETNAAAATKESVEMTHAGVEAVVKTRRMYLNVQVSILALRLCGSSRLDPIIHVAAVNCCVGLRQIPDQEKMSSTVSLGNLVCEDHRSRAVSRQYRTLIDQRTSDTQQRKDELFCVAYEREKNGSQIDLKIGSPQIVFIPDAIGDVLSFVRVTDESKDTVTEDENGKERVEREVVHLASSESGEDIETTIHSTTRSAETSTMKVSIKTDKCRFVLVDLGSQCTNLGSGVGQLAETIVVQGTFAAKFSIVSDLVSNETVSADLESQADAMEVFTAFGSDMRSPLQMLDPAEFSAHGSLKKTEVGDTHVELRAAALTPFEVVFSMHNAALLNAILAGLQESFSSDVLDVESEHPDSLTANETKHIEELASALETLDTSSRSLSHRQSSMGESSAPSFSRANSMKASRSTSIEVKISMPETRVTVVNDLQGLDEALLRVTVAHFVAGGRMKSHESDLETTFDFHLHTSILADFFDPSINLWNELLTKPWEITLKGIRASSARFKSDRLSTTVDLESMACCISFSEQFLASMAGANRMWSIYSTAIAAPMEELGRTSVAASIDASLKRSMAASAARNLITSLPYAVENHSGVDVSFLLPGPREDCRKCPNGSSQYFRFEPPRGGGFGGKRLYGQDVVYEKSVTLFLQDEQIQISHLDSVLGMPRKAHEIGDGRVLLTHVAKEGKTIVLHLSSYVEVVNRTRVPFKVSVLSDDQRYEVGVCGDDKRSARRTSTLTASDGTVSKVSRRFSIPLDLVRTFVKSWTSGNPSKLALAISPICSMESASELEGTIYIEPPSFDEFRNVPSGGSKTKFDVICRSAAGHTTQSDPFVVQVVVQMSLVDSKHLSLAFILEPRAVIENRMPVSIHVRTPMPHTFSSSEQDNSSGKYVTYKLAPDAQVEVFTPGPSIAVTSKTADMPVAGTSTDWMDGGWIDLPLTPEFRLPEPLVCMYPFSNTQISDQSVPSGTQGSEFFIAEDTEMLAGLQNFYGSQGQNKSDVHPRRESSSNSGGVEMTAAGANGNSIKKFFVTVCYYAVDHTGDLLFEQVLQSPSLKRKSITGPAKRMSSLPLSEPFGVFSSPRHRRRISLLPSATVPLRLMQLTMDGDEGFKRSWPFYVEEIAIGEGGIDCTSLHWENKEPSGYFAYRRLLNEHQSEVHVIPEFIVFNGSNDVLLVKESGRPEIIIESGHISSLRAASRPNGLELSFSFIEYGCRSIFLPVDKLGLKMALVKSQSGAPVGSVCVQTVIDTQGDSRLVVKVGDVKFGSAAPEMIARNAILENDLVRFRVRWTQLVITLNEALTKNSGLTNQKSLTEKSDATSKASARQKRMDQAHSIAGTHNLMLSQQPVATIVFSRFTVDYQRIFKDEVTKKSKGRDALLSPERAQLSIIIHDLQIRDETPNSACPLVFDSTSDASFFDLCIRVRGSANSELVKIDLFDLNLAHLNGKSDMITLNTSEEFIWKLLDLSNRIMDASGDLAGLALRLEEDKEHGGYVVSMVRANALRQDDEVKYTPPQSDRLYDISLARVSPFNLLLSFRRKPEASRYRHVRGAAIVKYFTQRLKFTIDKAELRFARYEDRTLKGPPDRLLESLSTVYISRMKLKLVTILSAASFQDWKYLASRDDGDDEFVEGDILRATGTLAGRGLNYTFKKVGKGLGSGVSDLSNSLGDTIEKSAGKIGVGKIGAGVNSVVSGVGDGFGETIGGVGAGTGKLLKGVGGGLGHVFGGVTGGALLVGKGIGKGIVSGDGKAVVSGLTQGASAVGGGVGQGVESAVMGAADGVLSAGQGLFSGIKSVGRGVGGAFKGKKKPEKKPM